MITGTCLSQAEGWARECFFCFPRLDFVCVFLNSSSGKKKASPISGGRTHRRESVAQFDARQSHRSWLQELRQERDALKVRVSATSNLITAEEADQLRTVVAELRRERSALKTQLAKRAEVSGKDLSSVMGTLTDDADADLESRDARYGLRGVRIGEAAHPGPPKLILRGVQVNRFDGWRERQKTRCLPQCPQHQTMWTPV